MLDENYIYVKYETSSFWTPDEFIELEMLLTLNIILSIIKINKIWLIIFL